jgi:hypothetical protein
MLTDMLATIRPDGFCALNPVTVSTPAMMVEHQAPLARFRQLRDLSHVENVAGSTQP